MKENFGNIYFNARKAAGLTQERWAEFLGISPEAVRQYENGIIMPGEDILLQMADISGMKPDLEAFSGEIAESYYRIIQEELKRAAPGKRS